MGKRSKMHKTGIPKALLKKRNLNKTILSIDSKKLNHTALMKENESSDEEEGAFDHTKLNKSMTNQSVNYDPEALKKYGSLLGLNDEEMESLAIQPIRNRRMVNNLVLSRRQKKKSLRREKKKQIERMEHNTKLNLSLNYSKPFINKTFAPTTAKTNQIPVLPQKNQFDLDELDKEIVSLEKNEVNKSSSLTPSSASLKIRTKKRNMRLLNEEKANIQSVSQKKSFNQNPLEAMAMHIKTAQLVSKRNKIVREEYNKHFNMLKLK